jgi:anti-sigma regulatory factor (Ser/Thr protein kinase)
LSRLLTDILEYADTLCLQQRNGFRYEPPKALPRMVHLDGNRLQQVLLNLLANASKFTYDGAVTLSVTAVAEGDFCTLQFAVSDTGVGIDMAQHVDIFGAFQQIQATSNSTGLGLFIAQRIVTAMGGTLSVSSSLGKGSTFFFKISAPVVLAFGSEWAEIGTSMTSDLPLPRTRTAEGVASDPTDLKSLISDEALDELACFALHGRLTDIEGWIERHIKETASSPIAAMLLALLEQFDFAGIHALALRFRSHSSI